MNMNVKQILQQTRRNIGLDKYANIMKSFREVDVAKNGEFQKLFNGFYRVRRDVQWQKIYYAIMEKGKTEVLSFEQILRNIYDKTGRVEASFVSKLVHTLNADMPIWDKFVLQNLGLKMPICSGEQKLQNAIRIYQEIVLWYKKAWSINKINEKIREFDDIFTEYKWFSKTKKIDFLLWQMREEKKPTI